MYDFVLSPLSPLRKRLGGLRKAVNAMARDGAAIGRKGEEGRVRAYD
jgi:hypothetical protein